MSEARHSCLVSSQQCRTRPDRLPSELWRSPGSVSWFDAITDGFSQAQRDHGGGAGGRPRSRHRRQRNPELVQRPRHVRRRQAEELPRGPSDGSTACEPGAIHPHRAGLPGAQNPCGRRQTVEHLIVWHPVGRRGGPTMVLRCRLASAATFRSRSPATVVYRQPLRTVDARRTRWWTRHIDAHNAEVQKMDTGTIVIIITGLAAVGLLVILFAVKTRRDRPPRHQMGLPPVGALTDDGINSAGDPPPHTGDDDTSPTTAQRQPRR